MSYLNNIAVIGCIVKTLLAISSNDTTLVNVSHIPKLTMKQGLVMNQVIATYAISNAGNSLCRLHTDEFKKGLRAFDSWALQMFDSSSKIQPNILMGNLVEYGGFEQCLGISKTTINGVIRGKHCGLRIIPGEKLLRTVVGFRNVSRKRFNKIRASVIQGVRLIWSVCIPDSCPADDVISHFNRTIMELAQGLDISATLTEEDCETILSTPHWTSKEYPLLALSTLIILSVVLSTLIDFMRRNSSTNSKLSMDQSRSFITAFSAFSNCKRLFSTNTGNVELQCLHGIRFISVCYVMFGHRFMTGMLFPSINSLYLIDWILEYRSTVIIGGTVCVDTFLFVSALLVSYGFFETVVKNGKFNIFSFYFHRYVRITLPLSVAVAVYSSFIQYFGSGPLWRETYQSMQLPCQYFWWSTLLHIQNYINPQFLCIAQTWYLSCDMVYFYFSPIILYPLWKFPVFGAINLLLFYLGSVVVNFYLAWSNKYFGGMPLTHQLFETKYFQKHYIAPHVRASPYLIGLAFGYLLYKRKQKMSISFFANISCWILALCSMCAVVLTSHIFQLENYDYNRLEASLYLSFSRSVWVSGIAWIIWSCVHGYGGFVNKILSLHAFRVLGRIGYGIFLFHMCFQFLKDGSAKMPTYYSNFYMLYNCCGDLLIMIIIGFLFSLTFEYPFLTLQTLLFKKITR